MPNITRFTPIERYFSITLGDGRKIELETPKLKVLKKISSLSKLTNDNKLSFEDI